MLKNYACGVSNDESVEDTFERLITGGSTVPKPEPLKVDSALIVGAGALVWAVALLVCLLVPSLHSGSRDFWPWACLIGMCLGLLGVVYIRRGRGNAKAA